MRGKISVNSWKWLSWPNRKRNASVHIREECNKDEGKILLNENLSQLYKSYIQPIFDIEFEEEPASKIDLLKKLKWIENIKENGRKISIYVKNIDYAKREALKEISKLDINVVSYQIRKSTLEDIFMRMVKQK